MKPAQVPSILVVCTANIIRSPMAAVILKHKLQRSYSFGKWRVESAGIQGLTGQPADLKAQVAIEAYSLDISSHVARRINRDIVSQHDLILTVEREQKEILGFAFSEAAERTFFIGELVGIDQDVEDPLSKPLEDYFATVKKINEILEKGLVPIILLAKFFSMRESVDGKEFIPVDRNLVEYESLLKRVNEDPVLIGIEESIGFPNEFRYELMELLMRLFPQDGRLVDELKLLSDTVPPSGEEQQLFKTIEMQSIVIPLTCLVQMDERLYYHPEIRSKLEVMRSLLTDPGSQELYKELELLFRKNLPPHLYRLGIWELAEKFKKLPYKVGDYEQAYSALRGDVLR